MKLWSRLQILMAAVRLISSWTVSTKFSNLCSRVKFSHLDSEKLPYSVLLSDVYVRTPYVMHDFPMYKSERAEIYFYRRSHYLLFSPIIIQSEVTHPTGPQIDEFAGLGVDVGILPSSWHSTADNKSLPFGSAIRPHHKWFVWIPGNSVTVFNVSQNYNLDSSWMLKPVCVSETVSHCAYGLPLYFSANQTGLNGVHVNNPDIDEFNLLPDIYRYYRPVYKHSNFPVSNWYLYFYQGIWLIGPSYNDGRAYWRSFDNATKPELITNKWEIWTGSNKGWVTYNVSLICRGEKTKKTCLNDSKCVRGYCSNNPLGEQVCTCPWGWTGMRCELPSPKCVYSLPGNVGPVELDAGTLVTRFCPDAYQPLLFAQQCQKQSFGFAWVSVTSDCRRSATTKTPVTWSHWSWTPWSSWSSWNSWSRVKEPSFNADEVRGLDKSLMSLGLILPWLLPCFHWLILFCRRNPADGDTKSTSCARVYSMHFYFGLLLWVTYILLSYFLHLSQYGQTTFVLLNIVALTMIGVSYLMVLIESYRSNERRYLADKFVSEGVSEYFIELFSARPVLLVSISCYHYESRTRTVYYTDANGNSQSRTETYQERVDTYSESKVFHYSSCRDVSNWASMPNVSGERITTIKLRKQVLMADPETESAYNHLQNELVEENRHMDTYIDCFTTETLPNFKERMMVYDSKKGLPWWMNLTCFWASTVFWCTWPFRWCMASITTHEQFTFVKEISIHPNSLTQEAFPPVMEMGCHEGPTHPNVIHDFSTPSKHEQDTSHVLPQHCETDEIPSAPPPPYPGMEPGPYQVFQMKNL